MKSHLLLFAGLSMGSILGFFGTERTAAAQSTERQRLAAPASSATTSPNESPPGSPASVPPDTAPLLDRSAAGSSPPAASVQAQAAAAAGQPGSSPQPAAAADTRPPAKGTAVVEEATTEEHGAATPPKAGTEPAGSKPLKIGGGAILWYYQPTKGSQKNNMEFYYVRLNIDADFGDGFGFHMEPRFRDTKLRSFFGGTAWLQEAYGAYTQGKHAFKLGKIYSRLGLFWDNSFWGNVQVYDGLKLAPDYGGSLEGTIDGLGAFSLGYAAQFFVVDGSTNVSIAGRDTMSIPDSRRRNEVVLRLDPTIQYAKDGNVRVGLSSQHLEADSSGIPSDQRQVWRYAIDVQLTQGGLGLWGEYLRQNGQTVTDYPIAGVAATATTTAVAGAASHRIDYYLAGGEFTYWRATARYNFSAANYHGVDVKEWMHVPAVAFKINEHLQLSVEYVHWLRSLSGVHEPYNRSLNGLLFVNL